MKEILGAVFLISRILAIIFGFIYLLKGEIIIGLLILILVQLTYIEIAIKEK